MHGPADGVLNRKIMQHWEKCPKTFLLDSFPQEYDIYKVRVSNLRNTIESMYWNIISVIL